jgi:hypothetical protein
VRNPCKIEVGSLLGKGYTGYGDIGERVKKLVVYFKTALSNKNLIHEKIKN